VEIRKFLSRYGKRGYKQVYLAFFSRILETGPSEFPRTGRERRKECPVQQNQRIRLRKLFAGRFSRDELRTLCFDLAIPYEDFPDSASGLAREMLAYCERRDKVSELIEVAREMRPDIDWTAHADLATAASRSAGTLPARARRGALAAGVWKCPDGYGGARFVGSITSRKYHSPECGWARRIAPENRLCFASPEAAQAFGYRPCGICEPPS
jgi:hypothetical protein